LEITFGPSNLDIKTAAYWNEKLAKSKQTEGSELALSKSIQPKWQSVWKKKQEIIERNIHRMFLMPYIL
jgi:hypothetical protein